MHQMVTTFGVRATDLGAASAGEAYVYSYN